MIDTKKVNPKANPHSASESPQKASDMFFAETSSKTKPPIMIGMLSRKLYSADFASSFPKNNNAEIVVPERDKPGRTAKPCATPTRQADLNVISGGEIVADFCLNLWQQNRMIAVVKKQKP